MVALIRDRNRRAPLLALTVVAALGLVAAIASVAMSGTKTGTALAFGTTVGPALLYAAIVAPVVFPFGPYALLAPLDYVLDFSSFGTITRVLGLATGAALLFYMLRTRRFVEPDRSLALWIVLYLWMGASVFWAIDVPTALGLLATALQLFALYIVASMFPITFKGLRIAVIFTVLGGIVSSAYGLYLFHNGLANKGDRLWIVTATSALDPNQYANALLLPIALAIVAALWTRSLAVRVGAAAGAALMLAALVLSGSRGASVAVLALIAYLLVRDRHRWPLAIMTAILGVTALATSGANFIARWGIADVNGGSGRVAIWQVGWAAFKDHWLIGAGYNNFQFAFDNAYLSVFQPFYTNWHRAPHNILLGTAVELGVLGVVLLIAAWAGQFRMLARIGTDDGRYPLRLALEAALIALFVTGMFADILIDKYLWLAFMLVALTRNAAPTTEIRSHA